MTSAIPIIIIGFMQFEGENIYKGWLFLLSISFVAYIIYAAAKSYHLVNTMEDKLGIGKTKV